MIKASGFSVLMKKENEESGEEKAAACTELVPTLKTDEENTEKWLKG